MTKAMATKEKVYAACEQIYAEGKPVTQEKVRAIIGGGSFNTIGKLVKEWKEQEDDALPVKSYPMPDSIKKLLGDGEIGKLFWDTFCQKVELINDNERVAELEKENESLRDKLEIAEQDSIRLEQLIKIREAERQEHQKLVQQQRKDVAEIQRLKGILEQYHS